MKFVLFFLCLLTFAFSEYVEKVVEYSDYNANYRCPLNKASHCCWKSEVSCCAPYDKPKRCLRTSTLCCKRKVYNKESGNYEIVFFHP